MILNAGASGWGGVRAHRCGFRLKNDEFRLKNDELRLINVGFIMKTAQPSSSEAEHEGYRSDSRPMESRSMDESMEEESAMMSMYNRSMDSRPMDDQQVWQRLICCLLCVYTCRRLIDLSLIDRSIPDCRT